MNNLTLRPVLKWLLVIVVVIFVGISGYLLGTGQINVNQILASKRLVEVSYDGGWFADPEKTTKSYDFYDNGEVYKTTGDGRVALYTTMSDIELETIRDLVNDPATIGSFIKNDRRFCPSAVDGVDNQITFTTTTGNVVFFSDCDYNLGDNELFSILNSIIRANR